MPTDVELKVLSAPGGGLVTPTLAELGGSGGGGGTQYAEGETAATITGTALMWEDAGDAPVPASELKPVPVNTGVVTTVAYLVSGANGFTRPADTTPYAVGDVVSNSVSATTLMLYDPFARANGFGGKLVKARLTTDQAACVAEFVVHLYHTAPATVAVDNAPHSRLWANRLVRIGSFALPALSTGPSGNTAAEAQVTDINLYYVCPAPTDYILALLETRTAFTPASGQMFNLELMAEMH